MKLLEGKLTLSEEQVRLRRLDVERPSRRPIKEDKDEVQRGVYTVSNDFVERCASINTDYAQTISKLVYKYDDGCYVYFDAFDEDDGGYCQYVLYDKNGYELGFTEPLNDDEILGVFELDDNHILEVKSSIKEAKDEDKKDDKKSDKKDDKKSSKKDSKKDTKKKDKKEKEDEEDIDIEDEVDIDVEDDKDLPDVDVDDMLSLDDIDIDVDEPIDDVDIELDGEIIPDDIETNAKSMSISDIVRNEFDSIDALKGVIATLTLNDEGVSEEDEDVIDILNNIVDLKLETVGMLNKALEVVDGDAVASMLDGQEKASEIISDGDADIEVEDDIDDIFGAGQDLEVTDKFDVDRADDIDVDNADAKSIFDIDDEGEVTDEMEEEDDIIIKDKKSK